MGIPAPSFNYDALNAQGGLGQGLAALTGSLANAAAKRRQAEADMRQADIQRQGLERLRSNDVIGQENAKRQGLEQVRQFDEAQGLRRDQYEMQGLEALARQGQQGMVDAARIRNYDADTQRKMRPTAQSQARDPALIRPGEWNQLDQQALQETEAEINRQKLSPEYAAEVSAAKGTFGMFKGPPARNLDQIRQQLLDANRKRRGLDRHQPWMDGQGSVPAAAAPAAAGNLRQRATAAFGGKLPPDVLSRLAEAEAGDPDAIQDVEESLSGGAPVAPDDDPTKLLGP